MNESPKIYESPKLNRVGDAEGVILGCVAYGWDIDMNWMGDDQQFPPEGE